MLKLPTHNISHNHSFSLCTLKRRLSPCLSVRHMVINRWPLALGHLSIDPADTFIPGIFDIVRTMGHRWLNWQINQHLKMAFRFPSSLVGLFTYFICSMFTHTYCASYSKPKTIEVLWRSSSTLVFHSSCIDTTYKNCLSLNGPTPCLLSSLFLLYLLSVRPNYTVDKVINTGESQSPTAGSMRSIKLSSVDPSHTYIYTKARHLDFLQIISPALPFPIVYWMLHKQTMYILLFSFPLIIVSP